MSPTQSSTTEATRVMVVEDDLDLQPLLEFTFEKDGYEVLGFTGGADAWEYLEAGDDLPACLVLDLMMPGIDGMKVLHRMQDDDELSKIPTVVLTAWDSEETVTKAFDLGADDYVTKPFSPNELSVRVRRLLR